MKLLALIVIFSQGSKHLLDSTAINVILSVSVRISYFFYLFNNMGLIKSLVKFSAILVGLFAFVIYYKFIRTIPGPVVQLEDGKVQGIKLTSRNGQEYLAYLGIPYGKPPLGPLRFMGPVPAEKWDGILDASKYGEMCAQFDYMVLGIKLGSEDCLYLNVYVPEKIPIGKKLPVIFYIHGGYFMFGSTHLAGANYFMDHEVILITIHYRLGALGFLSSGDGVIRGNAGLKDQNLALKWVQRNIEAFSGDKTKVTVIGESAGSASVHYQMLSPMSKGLFSRAIRESASALDYWTLYRNNKEQAARFAKKFNCPTDNSNKMAECLQSLDVHTLLDGHKDMQEFTTPLIGKFVPSIEVKADSEAFLTEEPIALLKSGRFNRVPFMTGFNHDEGLMHSTSLWANQTILDEADDWQNWAPKAFHYNPKRTDVSQKLRQFYFGAQTKHLNSRDLIQNFTNLFGDRLFTVGVSQAALLERKFVPTYLYVYEHDGGFNLGTLLAISQAKIHPILDLITERLRFLYVTFLLGEEYRHDVPGTSHYDEFPMLYSGVFEYMYMTSKDIKMSIEMVKLWVDFATDQKPLKFRGVEVQPTSDKGDLKFFHLTYDNPKMINDPITDRRLLWESFNLQPE